MEQASPSTPLIPPQTHQTPKPSRRRCSSGAKSGIEPSPSSKGAKSQPPSPEVISSLISSLTAIATPAEQNSPSLTTSKKRTQKQTTGDRETPARDQSKSPTLSQGFGIDYGAYKEPEEVDLKSYLIANTAFAPVVRISKPRAASSSSRSRTPTLKGSQQSLHSRDETASIGRLSTEPGLQPSPASGISSKTGGIGRIIGRKLSRETFSNGRSDRTASSSRNGDTLSPLSITLKHSNSRNSLVDAKIDEGVAGWQSPSASSRTPSHNRLSNPVPTASTYSRPSDGPGGICSARIIPSRQSSLNHTTANSAEKGSWKSPRQSWKKDDPRTGEDGFEEISTIKRIRELQKQKEKREKDLRKEERKAEKKRSRNSMPAAAVPRRTSSNQSMRHSMAEKMPRNPSQPVFVEDGINPVPILFTSESRRMSARKLASQAGKFAQAKAVSVQHDTRLSQEGRPVTPSLHQRKLSDPQLSPGRGSISIYRPQSFDSIDNAVEAYLASPRLTQKFRHPETGRIIAFAEVGDPAGFPVICCVGMGMTRYIMAFYDELAITLRLRLITIDRPGVGESEPCSDGTGLPLNWPDDVSIVCNALRISRFSLIAHSAGAVYALATALRLPQQVRGRLHLMAPWIPPSQMSSISSQNESTPSSSMPYSQKLLRVLPASFLRAANSSFMSSTTSSIMPRSPRRSRRRSAVIENGAVDLRPPSSNGVNNRYTGLQTTYGDNAIPTDLANTATHPPFPSARDRAASRASAVYPDNKYVRARQFAYDSHLTQRIWDLAQHNANPAVDLLVCLERRQTIGFRYVDITRACVFHHGSRDSRVPMENVKWLSKKMRRCEMRVLEGEGHSLMASAKIMAEVLTEVAREWEDWTRVTREGRGRRILSEEFDV